MTFADSGQAAGTVFVVVMVVGGIFLIGVVALVAYCFCIKKGKGGLLGNKSEVISEVSMTAGSKIPKVTTNVMKT